VATVLSALFFFTVFLRRFRAAILADTCSFFQVYFHVCIHRSAFLLSFLLLTVFIVRIHRHFAHISVSLFTTFSTCFVRCYSFRLPYSVHVSLYCSFLPSAFSTVVTISRMKNRSAFLCTLHTAFSHFDVCSHTFHLFFVSHSAVVCCLLLFGNAFVYLLNSCALRPFSSGLPH